MEPQTALKDDRELFQKYPSWREWVTPKLLRTKPIHRWLVFPHSFTSELVHSLIDQWGLGEKDHILDPFAGAGTTLLSAKERGISATGYDLLPLSVVCSRAKVAEYNLEHLRETWRIIEKKLECIGWKVTKNAPNREYPDLVKKALPGLVLRTLEEVANLIEGAVTRAEERDLFVLGLTGVIPEFSRAIATGGWLSWVEKDDLSDPGPVVQSFRKRIELMIEDIPCSLSPTQMRGKSLTWRVFQGDARQLPDVEKEYSAVITSPPYPNRHDYTRVFGVELMFAFLDWSQLRELRYQSFHSHPEARPKRPEFAKYEIPKRLDLAISRIKANGVDGRIPQMLKGYFLDMYLCLHEMKRVCRSGAKLALVVGNAQYSGVPVPVDELTAEIGEQVGLACEKLIVARYRGNSAQQMKSYGKSPSRETLVVFGLS